MSEMLKSDRDWYSKKDIVVEIKNGDSTKTKFIELTRDGIKKAMEIVNVKF